MQAQQHTRIRHETLAGPMDLPDFKMAGTEERSATWSVPWSDLMMVMFILFLVLFVFSLREKDRLVAGHRTQATISMSAGSQERLSMQPFFELIQERLIGYERHLNVTFLEDSSIVISLFGSSIFDNASTQINDHSALVLAKIGHALSLAQGRVVITGFAEEPLAETGTGPWETAAVRAAVLAEHLVRESGLNTHMLIIQASGTDLPLTPKILDPENQRSRWAQIRILPGTKPAV